MERVKLRTYVVQHRGEGKERDIRCARKTRWFGTGEVSLFGVKPMLEWPEDVSMIGDVALPMDADAVSQMVDARVQRSAIVGSRMDRLRSVRAVVRRAPKARTET